MGKIKKLKDVELVGGTEQSDVYPITSTKAIYDENNKRLDSIISELQKSADSSLETENKTIVGSINELKRLQDTGYLFKDVATPTTDPGTPKAKVFYIANGKGSYTNFGGLEVTEDDVVVLYWDSSWHKVSTGIASNEKLSELVNNLGSGYMFAGTASLTTNPGTPDAKLFYIPVEPGIYTNFNSLTVEYNEVCLFYFDGQWRKSGKLDLCSRSLIEKNIKKYIMLNKYVSVKGNEVDFGSETIIYYKDITALIRSTLQLSGKYTFSNDPFLPEYLVLHNDGSVEKVVGSTNVLINDILLLSYSSGSKMYFGLLGDQINAMALKEQKTENLLPANSRLNAYTPLRQSGAGLWMLRSGNAGNSITKEDGYFHVEMSRSVNPALLITRLDLTPYLNKTLRVRFSIKTENALKFIIGGPSTIATISASSEWVTIERDLTVENAYGDWRIMLYNDAGTTAIFDIKDFGIYDDFNNTELKQLFLQLNSKYFDSDNKLAGKRISILGDSISTFGVPDQNNATGLWTYPGNRCRYPQSDLLNEVNECYWKRLIDEKGMFLGINESWAGSRVSNNQSTDIGDLGPNRCISSQTRINHLGENGVPDIILVYAGTNDAGAGVELGSFNTENPISYTDEQIASLPVSTFADAYRAMLIRLQKTYPTSRIIVILPNFTSSYYSIKNLDDYVEIIKEECDFFGIQIIDIRTAGITIYNQNRYFPDGIHPNSKGMDLLYKLIEEKFIGLSEIGL